MKRLALLAVGLLVFSGVVRAEGNDAAVRGAGADSCGAFVAAENSQQYGTQAMYTQWAQGWMSGVNFMFSIRDKYTYVLPDSDAMEQWLKNYCTEHPLERYSVAVSKLFLEVMKTTQKVPDTKGR